MENREIRKEVHALAWPMVATNVLTRGIDIVAMILVGHLGMNAFAEGEVLELSWKYLFQHTESNVFALTDGDLRQQCM